MSLHKTLPTPRVGGTWIQTDRSAHEAWAILSKKPAASAVMHILCANLGDHNAVVISQPELARLANISLRSIQRAIADLVAGNWIEIRRIGGSAQVNAYVVNDRVAWQGQRDGIRYSLFSATVVVSEAEQTAQTEVNRDVPLRTLPQLGEAQIPSGEGLPPVSQRFLDGFEPDLPAAGQVKTDDQV